jgi:hypothetical protein
MICRDAGRVAPGKRWNRTVERALATPIERHRAHGAPIGHHCSVALVQDAGDGQDQDGLIFLSL